MQMHSFWLRVQIHQPCFPVIQRRVEQAWGQLCNLVRVRVGKPFFLSKEKKTRGEAYSTRGARGAAEANNWKFPSSVPSVSVRFDLVGGPAAVPPIRHRIRWRPTPATRSATLSWCEFLVPSAQFPFLVSPQIESRPAGSWSPILGWLVLSRMGLVAIVYVSLPADCYDGTNRWGPFLYDWW